MHYFNLYEKSLHGIYAALIPFRDALYQCESI